MIHLLERIAELPTMKIEIDDEGKYGRSYYTDDPWAKERVYTWHEGKYNVKALVEEVGEWNAMIAATFGAVNDMVQAERIVCAGIANRRVSRLSSIGVQGAAEPAVPRPVPESDEATG